VRENEIKRRPRYRQTQTMNIGRGRGNEDRDGEREGAGKEWEQHRIFFHTFFVGLLSSFKIPT
jgi:hypothetical protein